MSTSQSYRVSAGSTDHACRVCAGPLALKFRLPVLDDRYEASYFQCGWCDTLQITNPTWLAEAYANEASPLESAVDTGRFLRNFSAYAYISALIHSGVVSPHTRALDFGGGTGILTQMLVDAGFDAWQTDPYVPMPMLGGHRVIKSLDAAAAGQRFDLISAFEVFEHLLNPVETMRTMAKTLRHKGTVVISTGVYHPDRVDSSWAYLSRKSGQHVTFLSHAALAHLAAVAGMKSVGYWPDDEGFMIILSPASCNELHVGLSRASAMLSEPGFRGTICRYWDLLLRTEKKMVRNPLIQPAARIPNGRPITIEAVTATGTDASNNKAA